MASPHRANLPILGWMLGINQVREKESKNQKLIPQLLDYMREELSVRLKTFPFKSYICCLQDVTNTEIIIYQLFIAMLLISAI